MTVQAFAVAFFGAVAVGFGVAVFRTSSMVRSALALLASMAAIGVMFLAMEAEFLGVLQLMMMATEMVIMAIFMVMYMMDPGGLGKMDMSHQKRASLAAGTLGGLAALGAGVVVGWGSVVGAAPPAEEQTRALGFELMGRGMLIFETAGVTILVSMVAAICVAVKEREE